MSNDLDMIVQLEEKIHQLPPHLVAELDDFVSFLLQKHRMMSSQSLWETIQFFRATADFEAIGEVDEIFNKVRDRSEGRKVDFYE